MASAALGTAFRHLRDLFANGSVVGLEDSQLLARYCRSNDPAAFEALVNRHGPMVLATCRAVLRNEHDVEDAFQATFLVLAKKAGSIKGAEALGGWLHRVAYRASVQASVQARKRRRKEAEASAMAPPDASRPALEVDHDLRPILHEEIERLPEGHRLPVVLCDLEGLTYEQAAEQLRWTVPTLRCRLAKARQRLKGRLTRRGLNPLAVGPFVVPKSSALAIVPPALLKATVHAATGGSASAGAALLTHTILRGMLMTKLKIAGTATLASLALASAGLIAASSGMATEEPKPAMKPKPEARAEVAAKEAPDGKKPAEMVDVKGRVVAPDGKPVAGATVREGAVSGEDDSWPSATSGPDGRFTLRMALPPGVAREKFLAGLPWLVASASGYGLGWTEEARPGQPDPRTIKLVEEGPPIEGRVLDLEGRPVAGAQVEPLRIFFLENGTMADWVAKARRGDVDSVWQGLIGLYLDPDPVPSRPGPKRRVAPITATTGVDGRFKLTGIGRDRIADLYISGPGIATTLVHVFSRDEPEIRAVERGMMKPEPFIVHAPKFQVALPPSKRVEGTVRDADSGAPIAGVAIQAGLFDESNLSWVEGVLAWTDAQGHYRIDGLTRAEAYRLFLKPPKGQPYTNGTIKAPANSPALEPAAFDFTLKRGVVVRGRVTDKATGKPIGGRVNYYAFEDNPHLKDYPAFRQSYDADARLDDDGRFEVIGLPGRGLVVVRDEGDRYLPASGLEKIQGYDAKHQMFRTVPGSIVAQQSVIAEVNIAADSKGLDLALTADPGRSVAVEVVGPDGTPLGGTQVKGISEIFQTRVVPEESSGFEVRALTPGKPRRVIVTHDGRKLIGSVVLKGDEAGPVTIKLQPWGSVSGRIVDDEGKPRKGVFIGHPGGSKLDHPETDDILPGSDWNIGIRVGDDGRFTIEGLLPGLKYGAVTRASALEFLGDLFKDLTVAPGEAKDLGDLQVQPPKKQEE
jgi:RNA polymerase sigma factor (sigma-70 family)